MARVKNDDRDRSTFNLRNIAKHVCPWAGLLALNCGERRKEGEGVKNNLGYALQDHCEVAPTGTERRRLQRVYQWKEKEKPR